MKTTRAWSAVALGCLLATGSVCAQTFSLGSSSWGSGGTFQGSASGGSLLTSGLSASGAYFGTSQPDANTYVFGLVNTSSPTGAIAEYNLASTSLTAGTSLSLTFTGLSSLPDYLAYTGGALTAYSYSSGTLTLTLSTVNPVASASDTTGATLGSVFGLMIVNGSSRDFSGTVFRTDMFWDDLNPLANYAGTTFVAGLNAAGQNGVTATFNAYLPMAFLSANGITSPAAAEARLQKSGQSGVLLSSLDLDIYASANPGFAGEGTVWSYAGTSAFNLDGTAGNDDYVLATYGNASWSDGNIGITAVPEPAAWAALLGTVALLWTARRRRA